MTPKLFLETAICPALRMLPESMRSPEAKAMILAICLQESKLKKRVQLGGGPARGFAQFEQGGGVAGVLWHQSTRDYALACCESLRIPASDAYWAIAYNDILCAVFARLLLWADPHPLPEREDVDGAWACYLRTWRPGKPRPKRWPWNFQQAWDTVAPETFGPEVTA